MPKSLFESTSFKLRYNAQCDKVELKLISDADIYLFFEKGGASYISKSYSKTNNKYLKSYDLKQESRHNIYR